MNKPSTSAPHHTAPTTGVLADQPDLLVEINRTGPVAVVRVAGEVDLATAFVLWDVLLKVIGEPTPLRRIDVDLEHVTFLDATGLGILVQARQYACRAGADLMVCNAHGIVRLVFDVTGLSGVFGLAGRVVRGVACVFGV